MMIWVQISRFNVGLIANPFSKRYISNIPKPSTTITPLPRGKDWRVLHLHIKPLFVLLVSWFQNLHISIVDFFTLFLAFRLQFCRLQFAWLHALLVLFSQLEVDLHSLLPFWWVYRLYFCPMKHLLFDHY